MSSKALTRAHILNHRSAEEDGCAALLAAELTAAGAAVWRDDGGGDQPGPPVDTIERLMAGPPGDRWLLVVLTPGSAASERIQLDVAATLREQRYGRIRGVALVELASVDAADTPLLWRALPRFDATGGMNDIRDALLATLGLAPPSATVTPIIPAAPPTSPAPLAPSAPPTPSASFGQAPSAQATQALGAGPPQDWMRGLATPSPWYTRPVTLTLTGLLLVAVAAGAIAGWRASQSLSASASSQLSAMRATQTAEALVFNSVLPTSAYGPTPPGSCDHGPLASAWTVALENGNVRCAGAAAQVTGPAILTFAGNAGLALGATITIHMSAFSAAAVNECLDAHVSFPRVDGPRTQVHIRLCPDGTFTAGYVVGFSNNFPVVSSSVSLASGALDLAMTVSTGEWSITGSGQVLDRQPYGTGLEPAGALSSFTIQVDSGAQVALSAFTIATAA